MFVQKKYPKIPYTIHIELTEEESGILVGELGEVLPVQRKAQHLPRLPFLMRILEIVAEERRQARYYYSCLISSTPPSS